MHALHVELGARFTDYCGYQIPLCYGTGIIAEHLHTRRRASLFDVSHMVQVRISGEGVATALERLTPCNVLELQKHSQVYGMLTNISGGVIDDMMVSRRDGPDYYLVLNASNRQRSVAHLRKYLPDSLSIDVLDDTSLLALQGPDAAKILRHWLPKLEQLPFMHGAPVRVADADCYAMRCGYSGEDGFEISAPSEVMLPVAHAILAHQEVKPAGLGARDSLRIEAGLCLCGNELDEHINPIEAGLHWVIAPARQVGGVREGGFLGAEVLLKQRPEDCPERRVGVRMLGPVPARRDNILYAENQDPVGKISSSAFSPVLDAPVAMAYVRKDWASPGTLLKTEIRGTSHELEIMPLPLVAHNYYRVC